MLRKRCNLTYTKSALSGCTKKKHFKSRRYTAPSSISLTHFSNIFRFIVLYLNLVSFKRIVGEQLTEEHTSTRYTLGCTQGALPWCTKTETLRTRIVKSKICTNITVFFHFYTIYFILPFLFINFFKKQLRNCCTCEYCTLNQFPVFHKKNPSWFRKKDLIKHNTFQNLS